MTGLLSLTVVSGAVAFVAVGVLIHRDLARLAGQLASAVDRPDVQQDLDGLWSDAKNLHDEHAEAVEGRLRHIEAAVVQVRNNEARLVEHVNWMFPLVQRWARATTEARR